MSINLLDARRIIELNGAAYYKRERDRLDEELRKAHETIGYLVNQCKLARKDCMHPRNLQARTLEDAILHVEPEWKP